MKTEKNKARNIRIVNVFLVILFELAFYMIWSKGINILKLNPFMNKGNQLIAAIYLVEIIVLLKSYDGFKIAHLSKSHVIVSQMIALFVANITMLVQCILLIGDMRLIPKIFKNMVILMLLDVCISFLMCNVFDVLFRKLYPPKEILLIYQSYSPEHMIRKIENRKDKYMIKEAVHTEERWGKISEKLSQYRYVMLYDIPSEKRNEILKYCYMHNIEVYMTSKLSDTIIRSAGNVLLFDSPLLHMVNNDMTSEQKFFKRVLDLAITIPMIVITAPVMLAVAVAIKGYDGGDVFYKQERVTLHGRKFMIYKFRSMIVSAESDGKARLASKDDSRITPVGRFIRRTRLDELPQLFNVLKGEMSIVGPRPERPEIIARYEREIPEFACRLKVKGGLTGYAQIYGKYNTTPYDKLKLDLMYIQNYSIWLDLKIILMTLKIVFMKDSSEGIEET